jgi:hypothetical protein
MQDQVARNSRVTRMLHRLAWLALPGVVASCSSNGTSGGATQIVVATSANLLATVGTVLAISPGIRVEDETGKGIAGVTVLRRRS